MKKVINIRGTSGSGKTQLVRDIMERYGIYKDFGKQGLLLNNGTAVVGKYNNPCGGCDTLKDQAEIMETINFFYNQGFHIIFEGLMISTIHSTWVKFAEKFAENFYVIYLDTPLENCLQNVLERREKSGKTYNKPFNPENTIKKHKIINHQFTKEGFYNKKCLNFDEAYNEIVNLLNDYEQ